MYKRSGPSGGKEDAGDNKSPAHDGRVGSTPTSAPLKSIVEIRDSTLEVFL